MTHTTYRIRTRGTTYQTTNPLKAEVASRDGAYVTACTAGEAAR